MSATSCGVGLYPSKVLIGGEVLVKDLLDDRDVILVPVLERPSHRFPPQTSKCAVELET